MPVRFGIIGVGKWTRTVHIPNVLAAGGAIRALCSRTGESRTAGAALCPESPLLFERPADLLACEDVDAVIIATPNDLHAALTAEALTAGKHVLCEKPLALTEGDAGLVVAAAAGRDLVLAVGMELRSADVTVAALRAVREGMIGRPLMATGSFCRGWGGFGAGWRADCARSGGVYAELFCHTVDLQSCLIGEPARAVRARLAGQGRERRPECAAALFDYPCGAVGTALICLHAAGAPNEHPFEIMGEEGRLTGAVVAGELNLCRRDDPMPVDLSPRRDPGLPIHGFPGSLEMVREFIECIERRRAEPRAGLGEGLASLRAVQAIERSLAADVPVVLAEA